MENQEYITVKEFACHAGISIQAVYQSLNKKLKPYVKLIDGKKMLNINALEDIYGISVIKEVEQEVEQDIKADSSELLNLLKAQLDVKDKQITELQKLLDQQQQLTLKAQLRLELIEQKETEQQEDAADQMIHKSIWQRLKEFFS